MAILVAALLSMTALPIAAQESPAAQAVAVKGTATQPFELAVSLGKKILVARVGPDTLRTYQVAVGAKSHPTPSGVFKIRHIVWNPSWRPPAKKWAKGKKAQPPGSEKNPMKVVKLFFKEPDYYIHGTAEEHSLGGAASHGCIRMAPSDVDELARLVMENAGADKGDAWFEQVFKGASRDVRLSKGITIRIGL
ncbi:MAG TPA: L,D-transpeptidase family protein [Thermoanaerobaculia bacterium]|nr:L,D-transpeptidase family protein [Thermoanaerobaculia bacterium]